MPDCLWGMGKRDMGMFSLIPGQPGLTGERNVISMQEWAWTHPVCVHLHSLTELEGVARYLMRRRCVEVHLDRMDTSDIGRTIHFLAGVVYALEGTVERVGETTFFLSYGKGNQHDRVKQDPE